MARLAVFASGMVTAIGYNAPATLAALRAGISGVSRTGWMDHESGEPLRGARVSLPQWWEGLGKLADLAAPAIYECLNASGLPHDEVPVLLGVAARERPGRTAGIDEELLPAIERRLALRSHTLSRAFPLDQAGCAHALVEAGRILDTRRATRVVVAGVDSFLAQATLDAYIARRRLMTPGNSNGFFPGEGGCAVLVGDAARAAGEALVVGGMAIAREAATIESTEPFRGQGLTQAVAAALQEARVALKDVAWRLTDISGEQYKFKEALFAAGRLNAGERSIPLGLWHPIEYLGEIGAAVLPCLLAQAMHAAQEGYAPGRLALCHVGSDAGERAALVVGLRRVCAEEET